MHDGKMRSYLEIGLVGGYCGISVIGLVFLRGVLQENYEQAWTLDDLEYSWLFRLVLNLLGYSIIMVPGFIVYKYLKMTNYFDSISNAPPTCVSGALHACYGAYARLGEPAPRDVSTPARAPELAFCALGLMATYLVWGLLQEKIMTQEYAMADGSALRFTDAGALVLCNRVGALAVAGARLAAARRSLLAAPLYKFSYCALSNVLSAWCQYEALKYVSFPTQVLSKSCKVIPVMLMGKLISRTQYSAHEYLTAALISLGMLLFMHGTHHHAPSDAEAAATGVAGGAALLALYLCCDSFTASWQAALFQAHALHPLQMLCAVNLCSCALSLAALQQAPLYHPLLQHWGFLSDLLLLSLSSALGQLLIYRTIASFGAVVFTIIMTLRQAVSILVSCAVYGHRISAGGALGVALVFCCVLLRLHRARRAPRPAPAAPHPAPPAAHRGLNIAADVMTSTEPAFFTRRREEIGPQILLK